MTTEDKDSLRDLIIANAIEIGSEAGEDALTMRAIARRLDVGATTLYQHFESKAAILEEIWVWGHISFSDAINPSFENENCFDALIEAGQRYVKFAQANPWLYESVMGRIHPDYSAMDEETHFRCSSVYVNTMQCIEKAMKAGEVPDSVDPVVAALGLWAGMHGITGLLLGGRFASSQSHIIVADPEALLNNYVEKTVAIALHRLPRAKDPQNAVKSPLEKAGR